jgi:hypothetical protein
MIHAGKWKTIGGQVVEVKHDEEGYYIILDRSGIQDRLYYDEDGRCYRDRKLNPNENIDLTRNSKNSASFLNWDLVELIEEEVEVEVVKRNSNPIFMIDLCTE